MIYIVDDDRDVRASIAFMLRADAVEGQTFASGREFLNLIDTLQPGVLLVDVRMADMDGLELLDELTRRACGWPVVMMTGHGERELAETAMRMGASAFIEKPFEAELLMTCLSEASNMMGR